MIYKIIKNEYNFENNDEYFHIPIGYEGKSFIKSNILKKWKKISNNKIDSKYEDFLIIAMSVYILDKKLSRKNSFDGWTREISVEIPVLNYEKWNLIRDKLNKTLNFLTGDLWSVSFINTNERYFHNKKNKSHKLKTFRFDCVSLFSGGLDSFCGAIFLSKQNKNILFVGNEEYPKLKEKQENLLNALKTEFKYLDLNLETFTTTTRKNFLQSENTSRSRSLLFIAAAYAYASLNTNKEIPIYIPENGFIGMNIPLSPSRIGSCSTRTTHPIFIANINDILSEVGIKNQLVNPFKYLSKSQIIEEVCDSQTFKEQYINTYSCSHPAHNRYYRKPYPENCGYCYPCLIRKSSLIDIGDNTVYSKDINKKVDLKNILQSSKCSDYLAVRNSMSRFKKLNKEEVENILVREGLIKKEDVTKFYECYARTMDDLEKIFGDENE